MVSDRKGWAMKVLLASDCYTFQTGGVTSAIHALETGLREAGCEVQVLALSDSRRSYKDGDVYYLRSHRFPDYPEHRFSFAFRDPLVTELIGWKPDIVHAHTEFTIGWIAKAVARKAGCPLVMTTHTDYEYFNFGRFRDAAPVTALGRFLGKRVYRQAEKVIVPAEKARAFAHLQPVADKVVVIPNGIRAEMYQKPIPPEERNALFRRCRLEDSGFTLVTVTRLSKEKNVMELLRYFPSLLCALPEARLLVVGDGPDRKRLEDFSAKNGLSGRVCFTGRIDPGEVYRYYAMGDLFVSASTFELHSMSWLEAMACGLPMVCREDVSLRGVLEDGANGYIYRNEQEYVGAVSKILRSPSLRKQMHENALQRAETFSEQKFAERTLALYRSVCDSCCPEGNKKPALGSCS